MKKNNLFIFFMVLQILISGVFVFNLINIVNDARINKSNELYFLTENITNPKERLLLLLQSNILQSTESKELQIAEVALEANNNIYNFYLRKIENSTAVKELEIYKNFSNGDYEEIQDIINPVTNIGKMLLAIKENDYIYLNNGTAFSTQINNISKENSGSMLTFKVAKMFYNNNQPYISNYIAENILIEHTCNSDIFVLIAANNEYLKKYNKSLIEIEKAINCSPANISLYEKALFYAEKLNDKSKIDSYINKIEYLNTIRK